MTTVRGDAADGHDAATADHAAPDGGITGGQIGTRRTGNRRWSLWASVGAVFDISAVSAILRSERPTAHIVAGLVGLAVLTAGYIFAIAVRHRSMLVRVAYLLVLALVSAPQAVFLGVDGVLGLWIYVGIAGAVMLPGMLALIGAGVLAVTDMGWSAATGREAPWELALTLVALTAWMASFMSKIELADELRRTRLALADSAVAAERERIARDLHDILGHSLTAVTVKAGLTRRLVDQLPEDAPRQAVQAEIVDIERLAREALADIRATTAGYRDVSLAGELATAAALLRAAGIDVTLPTAASEVVAPARSVFGYVVREAATNVVRHARATRCTIELTPDMVSVTNDGAARAGFAAGSHGLAGLSARVAQHGGTLAAGPLPGGGFQVRAWMPSAGQASVAP